MKPSNTKKKTLYIDVEEEITGVIDKLRSVDESIVAMVVPKRASVFTSIVNLKLLKRAADQTGKRLVLITSDPSVLPMAGVVGMHVASNLNSKPYIPKAPSEPTAVSTADDQSPIAVGPVPKEPEAAEEVQAVEDVPNIPVAAPVSKSAAAASTKSAKSGKKPKFKVPNFNRFRLALILAIVVVILGGGVGVWAFTIAPKAIVTLRGETSDEEMSLKIQADTAAESLDSETGTVPSKKLVIKKTETERVPATGEKDTGNKASGTVDLQNCSRSDGGVNIPAGTGLSSGELTFIIQESVSLEPSEFTGGGTCKSETTEVAVIAQNAGDKYNVDARSYTVAGFSGVVAQGSTMTGGTSNIVKVVSTADIETAKNKLNQKTVGATQELKSGLQSEGYIPLEDTFTSEPGTYLPTPAAESEANEVAVSVETTYTMVGVKESDLKEYVKQQAEKEGKLDTSKEALLDDGLSEATYQLGGTNGTVTTVNITTRIVTGPELNQDQIKSEIAGKRRGEAEKLLADRPGVTEARVETAPFWNLNVPKKQDKITIIIEESNGATVSP